MVPNLAEYDAEGHIRYDAASALGKTKEEEGKGRLSTSLCRWERPLAAGHPMSSSTLGGVFTCF